MACVPVFFQPSGSAAQLTYGLMVCFMAFGAYVQFDPYEDRGNDAVAKLCQMQIFFSLLGSVALTSVSSEQEAGSNMDVLLVVLYLVPVQPPCRPVRPALRSPLRVSWKCAQVGLAMFLESPLLELAKKQLGRLREQQEKMLRAVDECMVGASLPAADLSVPVIPLSVHPPCLGFLLSFLTHLSRDFSLKSNNNYNIYAEYHHHYHHNPYVR